jgi:hypothetical protein
MIGLSLEIHYKNHPLWFHWLKLASLGLQWCSQNENSRIPPGQVTRPSNSLVRLRSLRNKSLFLFLKTLVLFIISINSLILLSQHALIRFIW